MMNIEIDYRDPLEPVRLECVRRAYRDAVKQTETHGAIALGMMTWRAHAAKGAAGLSRHHQIDAEYDRTGGVQRRRQAVWVHARIGVQVNMPLGRGHGKYLLYEFRIVNPAQLLTTRLWRIVMQQYGIQPARNQVILNGFEARRPFGMVRAHFMQRTT